MLTTGSSIGDFMEAVAGENDNKGIKTFPLFVVAKTVNGQERYYTGRSENAVYPKEYEFTLNLSHAKFFNHEGYARAAIRYHKWGRARVKHFFVEGGLYDTPERETVTQRQERILKDKRDYKISELSR